jgi:FlaG protein
MSLEIGRFTPTLRAPYAVAPSRSADAAPSTSGYDTVVGDIPPAPPADVRAQVDRAAEIAQDMADRNRELHFMKDEETGRLIIQVRDLNGKVIRTIPPSHALAIMSGEAS